MKTKIFLNTLVILLAAGTILAQETNSTKPQSTSPANEPNASATAPAPNAPHRGPGMWGPMLVDKLTTELNLSDEQQTKLKTLMENFNAGKKPGAPGAPGMAGMAGMHDPMKAMVNSVSNLTQEQKDRLAAIFTAAKEWRQKHVPEIQDHIKAMVEEFKKDKMDVEKLDALAQKSEKAREDARIFLRNTLEQIHGVLTPEQRVQAADKFGSTLGKFLNPPPPSVIQD